jgi:hypothetical protein
MADIETTLREALAEHGAAVRAPADLAARAARASRRRRSRDAAVCAVMVVIVAAGAAAAVTRQQARPGGGTLASATAGASEAPAARCSWNADDAGLLAGPAAEALAARIRTAAAGLWHDTATARPCRIAPGWQSPFGEAVGSAARVPFSTGPAPQPRPADIAVYRQDRASDETAADEFAKQGGAAAYMPAPGQAADPAYATGARILADSRPTPTSRAWICETRQTVTGVLWRQDGLMVVLVAARPVGDTEATASLQNDEARILNSLAASA